MSEEEPKRSRLPRFMSPKQEQQDKVDGFIASTAGRITMLVCGLALVAFLVITLVTE